METQKWRSKDAQSFAVSEKIIALLRHGPLLRDQDGPVEFWGLKQKFKSGFPYSAHWSNQLVVVESFENRRRTQEEIPVLY